MTIVYALVSRQKTVLAEYTDTLGNFPTVTRMLLAKIPEADGKMTYVYDDYVFHYVVEDGICYLCMSDEQNKHRVPYAFLLNMKELFLSKYGLDAAQTAIAFSFNDEFSTVISDRMTYFNSGGSADNIDVLKNQIDEVKEGMVQNIEKVLERGEKIELLVDKTDRLNQQAFRFESTGRRLARTMYWRRIRNMTIFGFIVLIAVFIVTATACGGLDFHRCSKK